MVSLILLNFEDRDDNLIKLSVHNDEDRIVDITTYNAKSVVFTPDHDALKVFFYSVEDIARSTKKA